MAYRVELTKSAGVQLEELYLWVVERAPSRGAAWFNDLERAILSLEQFPKRCRMAPRAWTGICRFESSTTAAALTSIAWFFTIDDAIRVVRVVHIRRGARQRPSPGELEDG